MLNCHATNRLTHTQTDATEHYTHALSLVGVSNKSYKVTRLFFRLTARLYWTDRETAAGHEIVDGLRHVGRVYEIVVRIRVLAVAAL